MRNIQLWRRNSVVACLLLGIVYSGAVACGGLHTHDNGPICGNGIIEEFDVAGSNTDPEICDDGDHNGDYGYCNQDCKGFTKCGNGIIEGPETCDDGESNGWDGPCSPSCELNKPSCGNGILEFEEECDDGNLDNNDACVYNLNNGYPYCSIANCGDGYIQEGVEQCDEGANNGNGGCSINCQVIPG